MQDQKDSRKHHVSLTEIPSYLKTMVDILVQEEIRLENEHTGVCMEYMLKHGVLGVLVNISEADFPLGIRGETIRTITTLVNLLDVKFLVHSAVHIPTLKLLKLCIQDRSYDKASNFYVDELIDLLYTLCSKIHSSPQLLTIFFYDRRWLTTPHRTTSVNTPGSPSSPVQTSTRHDILVSNKLFSPNQSDDTSSVTAFSADETNHVEPAAAIEGNPSAPRVTNTSDKPDYECLLFSYLLQFIHREGKSGDYARTGLLFLLEICSGNFRDYILYHSDLCQILAAGLGALYSQLPRKLLVRSTETDFANRKWFATLPLLVTRTSSLECDSGLDLDEFEVSSSSAFKTLIDSFLKTTEFCQDVLQRCPSRAICMTLLSDIQSFFMENILYPSMLESSDTDGSAVAVISYVEIILLTLQDGELLDLFLRYLIGSDDEGLFPPRPVEVNEESEVSSVRSYTSSQLGSSQLGSSQLESSQLESSNETKRPSKHKSPGFLAFTLKDLLYNNLQSQSVPTVIAALKLLNTIISKHPQYCLPLLTTANHFPAALLASPTSSIDASFGECGLTPEPEQFVTVKNHHQESQAYFLLINNIDPRFNADGLIPGFEPYLRNAEMVYDSYHSFTFLRQQQAKSKGHVRKQTMRLQAPQILQLPTDPLDPLEPLVKDLGMHKKLPSPTQRHRLRKEDPLLSILMDLLSRFFSNPCELNLVLTGLLSSLTGCPFVSPDEWVSFTSAVYNLPQPDKSFQLVLAQNTPLPPSPPLLNELNQTHLTRPFDDDFSEDEMELIQLASLPLESRNSNIHRINCSNQVVIQPDLPPPIFNVLNELAQEVNRCRRTLPNLDSWLEDRRQQLLLNDMNHFSSACLGSFVASPISSQSLTEDKPSSLSRRSISAAPDIPSQPSTLTQNNKLVSSPVRKLSLVGSQKISSTAANYNSLDTSPASKEEPVPVSPYFPAPTFQSLLDQGHLPDAKRNSRLDSLAEDPQNSTSNFPSESSLEFNQIFVDNILILEEAIKELIATLHVRRGQGLDEVLFT